MTEEYLTLEVDKNTYDKLVVQAEKRDLPLEEFITMVLAAALQKDFEEALAARTISEEEFAMFAASGGLNPKE